MKNGEKKEIMVGRKKKKSAGRLNKLEADENSNPFNYYIDKIQMQNNNNNNNNNKLIRKRNK